MKRSVPRIVLGLGLRLGATALVFWYLFSRIDAAQVGKALSRLPAASVLGALLALAVAIFAALVRWRALLVAYGARACPSWPVSIRLYLISMFYNLLPGAVGGDVYRGYATRHQFADGSATRSIGVVFIERVLGLLGLLLLAAGSTLVSAHHDREVLLYAALGLAAASGAVVAVALGRRLVHHLPGYLGRMASSLPVLERPLAFLRAVPLSVFSQLALACAGHLIIRGLTPRASLLDSLTVFPLGSLAAYFPLTVAGAGARDTALVLLFGRVGVAAADALATSLTLLALNVAFAVTGGLLSLAYATSPEEQSSARAVTNAAD